MENPCTGVLQTMENSGVKLSVTLRPLDCTRTGSEDIATTEQSITTSEHIILNKEQYLLLSTKLMNLIGSNQGVSITP